MMQSSITLNEILAPARITAAWEKVRANRGAAGEDHITIADLAENFAALWPSVENAVRSGSYRAAPLRPARIPKPSGGTRTLAIPSVIDRILQQSFAPPSGTPPGDTWWDELFPDRPHAKPPGNPFMLRLIVYDIASPKRLRRVAKVCEDFGLRVQKSVFECWLEKERFDRLWESLLVEIDKQNDSLVAYTLDATAAQARRQAGNQTILTEKRTRLIL